MVTLRVEPSMLAVVVLLSSACNSEHQAIPTPTRPTAGGSGGSGGSLAGTGGGAEPTAGGSTAGGAPVPGPPGCGLGSPAFCETFDAPVQGTGRARELDVKRWSLSRLSYFDYGTALPIRQATIPACRANVPSRVFVPNDVLVCDPTQGIASRHLLVAAAAQNYGNHSLRIRQPFDFAGRTGKIVFDADLTSDSGLLGWIGVSVTEDPIGSPSYSELPGAGNSEGGVIPRNGVQLHLARCPSGATRSVRLRMIHEFRGYAEHRHEQANGSPCVATQRDRLNRVEIRLSQQRMEVWATPFSPDGTTFDVPVYLGAADLQLGFTRGYVHLTAYNHASFKYTKETSDPLDAWVTRWDNVGFDGPIISDAVEFEADDALVRTGDTVDIGWVVQLAHKPMKTVISVRSVETAGAQSARLAFTMRYLQDQFHDADFSQYGIVYRLNGGASHTELLTPGERGLLQSGVVLLDQPGRANAVIWGALGQVVTVPVSELRDGDNTLEIAIVGVPDHYASTLANVDLIVGR